MSEVIERYIDRILAESTPEMPLWNVERARSGAAPHWNYIDGCMLSALLRLGQARGEPRFEAFAQRFLGYYVAEDGALLGYDLEDWNLDNICEGNALLTLYERTGEQRYLLGVRRLVLQLENQPRTCEGSYWHKRIYPNQVWLDGLYMAQVFRARLAAQAGDADTLADILRQFQTVRCRMYDPAAGLYRHGYDASKKAFWADENGLSRCVWLRAEGWLLAALADTAAAWPPEAPGRDFLQAMLAEALAGLFAYQHKASGLFYQVPDQGDRPGNYLETSGAALTAYACLRAANSGLMPPEWRARGEALLAAITRERLRITPDGRPELTGICLVAGLGPDNNRRRDGSFAYYISEPVVDNEAKGVAPFLMAYAEAGCAHGYSRGCDRHQPVDV